MHLLGWIIVGGVAGWIASLLMQARGQGCIVNIALGLVGAVVGGFLFRQLGGFSYDGTGFIASTFVAVIGAVIVLALWNAVRRR
jgi:uncharacterized membrane protein YeaQ/YmgE (transglycosylase-associated protein family)